MAIDGYTSFDRIAIYYDSLKKLVFGSSIDDAQKYFLDVIPPGASVIVIGGGTGELLVEILRSRRAGAVTYLEFSEKMLHLAQRRSTRYQQNLDCGNLQIHFKLGSVEALARDEKFDAVFTPFVLDVIEEKRLPGFMKAIDSHLHQNALWFFSDFRQGQSTGFQIPFQKFLLRGMLFFFKITIGLKLERLPEFEVLFDRLGYKKERSQLFYRGFIQSKVLKRSETSS